MFKETIFILFVYTKFQNLYHEKFFNIFKESQKVDYPSTFKNIKIYLPKCKLAFIKNAGHQLESHRRKNLIYKNYEWNTR